MGKKSTLKKDQKLMYIVAAIVIIVIIIALVFVFTGKDKNKENKPAENANQNQEVVDDNLNDQIDYNNKENVEIVNNVKQNNSEALSKEKDFLNMKVRNINLSASQGTTKFIATVENTSGADFKASKITVIFKNKEGKEIEKLNAYLGDIKVGGTAQIDATTTSDLSNAYDFEITK